MLTLLTGTTLAQLVPILISPILSRIYLIEDFGYLATLMSIVSPLVIISSLRYELAIVLPKKNSDAVNLLALSLLIVFIISMLSLLGVFLFIYLNPLQNNDLITKWLYFCPIIIFSLGFYQCLNNWANRLKKYKDLAVYRISNSVTNGVVTLSLGLLKTGPWGLLIGIISGYLTGQLIITLTLYKSIKKVWHHVSFHQIFLKAKEYKIFPFANSIQATSDVFQINGIIYFTSYFFNSAIVGWYSFAIRILQAPMNLIGAAIGQVFYQQASYFYNNEICLQPLVKKTIIKSALIGSPVLLILILFGPALFEFVLGENWREAGVYAQILAPFIYLDFIRSPISQIPIVINKQKKLLLFSIISNTLLIISMLYGGLVAKDIKYGFGLLSISQSIYIISIIIWIYKISKRPCN